VVDRLTGTVVTDCSLSGTSAGDEQRSSRSNNLEMTERFEISLKDRTPVASISGFFKRGVINANLNTAGTTPSAIDLLNRAVKNGATSLANCFRTDIGTGSAAQLLFGTCLSVVFNICIVAKRITEKLSEESIGNRMVT